jgi:hypothetical protein
MSMTARQPKELVRDALLQAAQVNAWLTLAEIQVFTDVSSRQTLDVLSELRKEGYSVERRMRQNVNSVTEYRIEVAHVG